MLKINNPLLFFKLVTIINLMSSSRKTLTFKHLYRNVILFDTVKIFELSKALHFFLRESATSKIMQNILEFYVNF